MQASDSGTQVTADPVSLTAHIRDTVRLSLPVMISRAGILTMILIDTVMVGRFSSDELA